jgi:hypothetical protein
MFLPPNIPELLDTAKPSKDDLVDVTPPPVLPRFERTDDRMMGGVKMLRGMAVL